jgi:shikimate dehydrogenase
MSATHPESRPARYAVFGNPVAHSKSPRIHQLFAAQTGQNIVYEALLAPLDGFARALADFQARGGRGANVTVPFKQEAWALANERSPRAQRAGAVNTLVLRDDGSRYGDTTDGLGLVRDLCINHGVDLAGQRVLLLGAGGAARGVLEPLLAERPQQLVIANRTLAKAEDLVRTFADLGTLRASSFEALAGASFDVIINATAAGLHGTVAPLPAGIIAPRACAYDMMYGDQPTDFVRWAHRHGASRAYDGLGMLVEQAAEAFYLWRGVRPETAPVIAQLRETGAGV